ncbi:hypothetical protein KP79_PYT06713 [Mizuhopecten yessoensis]|uniref:Uncharacterized protein n=1 Tax=Mizuhopecten yessoensis TaxID=6573 RepID=A0A210R4X9_MIZYE|nr:hypothetical protein KP79_PYT06713 [Mizuhopecten yessoensis]
MAAGDHGEAATVSHNRWCVIGVSDTAQLVEELQEGRRCFPEEKTDYIEEFLINRMFTV